MVGAVVWLAIGVTQLTFPGVVHRRLSQSIRQIAAGQEQDARIGPDELHRTIDLTMSPTLPIFGGAVAAAYAVLAAYAGFPSVWPWGGAALAWGAAALVVHRRRVAVLALMREHDLPERSEVELRHRRRVSRWKNGSLSVLVVSFALQAAADVTGPARLFDGALVLMGVAVAGLAVTGWISLRGPDPEPFWYREGRGDETT